MGSEYFINSETLQSKIRDLLPSQGGAGAGFDLSASTQIVPIVDLTESAEGSDVRSDLQTALSFGTATSFNISNATTVIVNNTGYFRIFGTAIFSGFGNITVQLTDGASTKIIVGYAGLAGSTNNIPFDFVTFTEAGESLSITCSTNMRVIGSTRQIADITGTLVNP